MIKKSLFILSLIILNSSLYSAPVKLARLNNEMVQKDKVTIANEIKVNKAIKYSIGACLAAGVAFKVRSYINQPNLEGLNPIVVDGKFDEKSTSALKEMVKLFADGKLVAAQPTAGWDKKLSENLSASGTMLFSTFVSTLAFGYCKPAMDWLFHKFDMPWIFQQAGIQAILENLNLLVVISSEPRFVELLNEGTEITRSASVEPLEACEVTEDRPVVKNVLVNDDIVKFVKKGEFFSSKLVESMSKVIGFLEYRADVLVANKEFDKAAQLRACATEIKGLVDSYCNDMELILTSIANKTYTSNNISDVITNFSTSFSHVMSMTSVI